MREHQDHSSAAIRASSLRAVMTLWQEWDYLFNKSVHITQRLNRTLVCSSHELAITVQRPIKLPRTMKVQRPMKLPLPNKVQLCSVNAECRAFAVPWASSHPVLPSTQLTHVPPLLYGWYPRACCAEY